MKNTTRRSANRRNQHGCLLSLSLFYGVASCGISEPSVSPDQETHRAAEGQSPTTPDNGSLLFLARGGAPETKSLGDSYESHAQTLLPCMDTLPADATATEAGQADACGGGGSPSPPPPPPPPPPPSPSPTSTGVLGPKPNTSGTSSYLLSAGMAGSRLSGLFTEGWVQICEIHAYARRPGLFGSPNRDEQTCTYSPPLGSSLVVLRTKSASENGCSWSYQLVRGGTNFAMVSEIDTIYGKAKDAALSIGNVALSVQLGQMHDYHKSTLLLSSNTDIAKLTGTATSGGGLGANGWCDIVIEGLLLKN